MALRCSPHIIDWVMELQTDSVHCRAQTTEIYPKYDKLDVGHPTVRFLLFVFSQNKTDQSHVSQLLNTLEAMGVCLYTELCKYQKRN